MNNTLNSHIPRHINKHGPIIDINHLLWCYLGDIQCNAENISVRLAVVNEAGRDEKIDEPPELEGPDSVLVQFAPLVAYRRNLQPMACFEMGDQFNHLREGA